MNRRGFIAFLIAAPVTRSLPWRGIAKVLQPVAPGVAAAIGASFTDIVIETFRKNRAQIIANITHNNTLLRNLQRADKRKKWRGGLTAR